MFCLYSIGASACLSSTLKCFIGTPVGIGHSLARDGVNPYPHTWLEGVCSRQTLFQIIGFRSAMWLYRRCVLLSVVSHDVDLGTFGV